MTAVRAAAPIWPGLRGFHTPWAKWLAVFAIVSLLYLINALRGFGVLGMLVVAGGYLLTLSSTEVMRVAKQAPLLIYPLLAILSATWSEAPTLTLRLSVQLFITAVIALSLYRTVPFRIFMSALFFAGLMACIASLISQPEAMTGVTALHGIAGSKNAMAYIANIFIIGSLAIIIDRSFGLRLRLIASFGILVGLICLAAAQSVGALAATAVGCGVALAVRAFLLSAVSIRAVALIAALLLAPALMILQPLLEQAVTTFAQDVLDKDTETLTGRTYLWDRANEYIREKPIVGHGFGAFWREGSLDAEGIWRAYGITNRAGFNFHNQFYEALVDLGLVGLAALAATLVVTGLTFVIRVLRGGSPETPFYFAMFVSLAMRVTVESALVTQFTVITIVFFMSTCAALYGPEARPAFGPLRLRRLRQTKESRLTQQRERVVARRSGRPLVQQRETPRVATRRILRSRKKKLRQTKRDRSKSQVRPENT